MPLTRKLSQKSLYNDEMIIKYITLALNEVKDVDYTQYETKDRHFSTFGFSSFPSIVSEGYVRRFSLFQFFDPSFDYSEYIKDHQQLKPEKELIEFRNFHQKRIEDYVNQLPILINSGFQFVFTTNPVIYVTFQINKKDKLKLEKNLQKLFKEYKELELNTVKTPENYNDLVIHIAVGMFLSFKDNKYVCNKTQCEGDLFSIVNTSDNIYESIYITWAWLKPFIHNQFHDILFDQEHNLLPNLNYDNILDELAGIVNNIFNKINSHIDYKTFFDGIDINFNIRKGNIISFKLSKIK